MLQVARGRARLVRNLNIIIFFETSLFVGLCLFQWKFGKISKNIKKKKKKKKYFEPKF